MSSFRRCREPQENKIKNKDDRINLNGFFFYKKKVFGCALTLLHYKARSDPTDRNN